MAENKKSFILYCDYQEIFTDLSKEDAGELIQHIFAYVNDENPVTENKVVKASFTAIKLQLKRDLKKWDDIREKRSLAGKKSAESRQQTSTNSTSVKSVEQTSTNSTVNDTVTVNVNDTVTVPTKVGDLEIFHPKEIVDFVNKTFGKEFTENNLGRLDRDLINDLITVYGYSKQQILTAWGNIPKNDFHRNKKFNMISFRYLSETKTIEQFVSWKDETNTSTTEETKVFKRGNLNL
tara:strand:- start:24856 stop:25563 length:708 start_codon:yes stop_codon:yes gene_type:complete